MNGLTGTLALNDDVIISPVSELPDDLRAQAGCLPNDFAVSRTRERGGSSIIDADSARLLDRFREPRTLVEAVILYAREQSADATKVLENAYPFLKGMVQRRVLVPATSLSDARQDVPAAWGARTRLPMGTIVRTLQVLDDSEVHQIERPGGEIAILKVEHPHHANAPSEDSSNLSHEARVLTWLDGRVAPRLLAEGESEGRHYLVLERIAGIDAAAAMQEHREQSAAAQRRAVLDLSRAVCAAYAELHSAGVIHGDVHPRNVLVLRDGSVRLIDFGFATAIDDDTPIARLRQRGGVPFFFEPEFARAALDNTVPPPASAAGEQFAVAALIFLLATGEYWQRFRLGRREMLLDIADGSPRRFVDCGTDPWPAFEDILGRALSHTPEDRWPSMAEFTSALNGLSAPTEARPSNTALAPGLSDRVVQQFSLDGPLFGNGLPAPAVSVTYGSAGIALGALLLSQRRAAPELLAVADAWIRRSALEIGDERGFYNPEIEITHEMVGEASPYHTPSGVQAVDALIARAWGNGQRQDLAVAKYLECAARRAAGLDLVLGRASTLLGAAILLDALPQSGASSEPALRAFGMRTMEELWIQLDKQERVGEGDVRYLGIAHGWAGFLYATLTWCAVARVAAPNGVERRLDELAALALPAGRGLEWAWVLGQPGDAPTMAGWCNGTAGYVFLWTLANKAFGHARYLEAAVGAGWNTWESLDPASTLCCGLAGRGYALLNLFRHTGERRWLDRARTLCARAIQEGKNQPEYPHSLYKGELGVAVLATDLEDSDWGRMPFFEPAGYRV